MKQLFTLILLLVVTATSSQILANDFPGRKRYPRVPYIELDELYRQKDNVVFIDARSQYEFDTLRIKGSILVPLSLVSREFEKIMRVIREENPNKKLVFYCNGHNCMKSYKAARRSLVYVGQENVYAYDAGIFDWAKKYPEETLLLGKQLEDTGKLISKERFKTHMLNAEKFIKAADANTKILDIRDRVDRDGFYVFSGHESSITLNDADKSELEVFFDEVRLSGKPLYVYDNVGKQVRWFQYYIESKGIKEYYFMEGGAEAFFKIPISRLMD